MVKLNFQQPLLESLVIWSFRNQSNIQICNINYIMNVKNKNLFRCIFDTVFLRYFDQIKAALENIKKSKVLIFFLIIPNVWPVVYLFNQCHTNKHFFILTFFH